MKTPLDYALSYAQKGWALFPLHTPQNGVCDCARGKECDHTGKHPRTPHGSKDATTDVMQITKWWQMWQGANIAIATGAASGVVVLDIDKRNGGFESYKKLTNQYGKLPKTLIAKSGGDGRHIYFKHPQNGVKIKSKPLTGFQGIDIKADGGSIIAPPSRHASGGVYEWKTEAPPTDLPPWLLQLITEPQHASNDASMTDGIPQGERNHRLTSIAGALRRQGLPQEGICAALSAINKISCNPPLPDTELQSIARSISNYAATTLVKSGGGIIFNPVSIPTLVEELKAGDGLETKWILKGLIPSGGLVLLAGAPKAGKSTLAGHITTAVSMGTYFLGCKTTAVNVLWLALEERRQDAGRRLYALGAGENVFYQPAPFKATEENLQKLASWAAEKNVRLVVVDTLPQMLGVESENDAAEINKALEPLLHLAREKDIAFLLLHHLRKGQGAGGEIIRGSSAIFGSVDIAVTFEKDKDHKCRRSFQTYSRYDETPENMVIELTQDGYQVIGKVEDVKAQEKDERLKGVLSALTTDWQTVEAIAEGASLSVSTARRLLRKLVSNGVIESNGGGKKKDPEVFRLKPQESTEPQDKIMIPPQKSLSGGINGGNNEGMTDAVAMVMEVFEGAVIVSH